MLTELLTKTLMLFPDFSSAFKTIIPQNLVDKLGPLDFSTPHMQLAARLPH